MSERSATGQKAFLETPLPGEINLALFEVVFGRNLPQTIHFTEAPVVWRTNYPNLTVEDSPGVSGYSPGYHDRSEIRSGFGGIYSETSRSAGSIDAIGRTPDGTMVAIMDGSLCIDPCDPQGRGRTIPLPDSLRKEGIKLTLIQGISGTKFVIGGHEEIGGRIKGTAVIIEVDKEGDEKQSVVTTNLLPDNSESLPVAVSTNGSLIALSYRDSKAQPQLAVYDQSGRPMVTLHDYGISPVFEGTSVYYISVARKGDHSFENLCVKKVDLKEEGKEVLQNLPSEKVVISDGGRILSLHNGPDRTIVAVSQDGTMHLIDPKTSASKRIDGLKRRLRRQGRVIADAGFALNYSNKFFIVTRPKEGSGDYMIDGGALAIKKEEA